MKKSIAVILSFLLLTMTLLPIVHAENAVVENAVAENAVVENAVVEKDVTANAVTENPSSEVKVVKTSEDYKDLKVLPKELKDKFDFFIHEDAFEATSEDMFDSNKLVTREEFVKVAKVIFSLPTDKALTKPSYLEDFGPLGLVRSEGGVVDSELTMKRQELAKFLIYGLGLVKDARKVAPITDTGVSDQDRVDKTYSRFVTLALQLKLMKNQEDGRFHGSDYSVTRKMLVEAAYEAKHVYADMNDSGKVSIVEAKAVGAKKVSVSFNKMFDAAKANKAVLTMKKDGSFITGITEWSDDNKSVTITIDSKLSKGKYTVELSGLDAASVEKNTSDFTAEDEQIKSLEFVNSSDKLPRSKVTVELKQKNQYGEQTELSANRFEINVGSGYTAQIVPDKQAFKIDLSKEKRDARIPITVFDRERALSVNKIFTIGDQVLLSKIDLGVLTYNGNKPSLQPGNKAYLSFSAYDQYGNRVYDLDELQKGIKQLSVGDSLFVNKGQNFFYDYDNDGYPELELEAATNMNKDTAATLQLVALGSGESVTKKISVLTPKKPASIEIKDLANITMAVGDENIPIDFAIRDAEGYEFTAEEKVALAKSGKIEVHSTGGLALASSIAGEVGPIDLTGANNGKINIKEVQSKGAASIEINIFDISQKATADLALKEKRKPATLEKSGFEPDQMYTVIQGKTATPNFTIKDQYYEDYTIAGDEYQVEYTLQQISGTAGAFTGSSTKKTSLILNDTNPTIRLLSKDSNNQGIKLTADASKMGAYQLTATLVLAEKDPNQSDPTKWPIKSRLNSIGARAQTYTWKELDKDLTYFLNTDTSLFAFGKYFVDQGKKVNKKNDDIKAKADQADAALIFKTRGDLAKGLEIQAKNKDGSVTTIPTVTISSVQISDPNVVAVDNPAKPTKIVGLNPGSAVGVITFNTDKGVKMIQVNFTVFTSNLAYSRLDLGVSNSVSTNTSDINGRYIWDASLLKRITVTDDIGLGFYNQTTYANTIATNTENLTPFMSQFGVSFVLSDITYKPGTTEANKDTFYMTDDYKLVFIPKSGKYSLSNVNLKSFKLTVSTPDNKSKSLVVTLK
jgi:methionine-rich copper-binding protein CopC